MPVTAAPLQAEGKKHQHQHLSFIANGIECSNLPATANNTLKLQIMIKKHFLFVLYICLGTPIFAQSLMHSAGSTISVMTAKLPNSYYSTDRLIIVHTDVTYFPRLSFLESDNSSFSVGAPLSLGFGIANNLYDDYAERSIFFGFDAPLVLDYNIGCKSSPENESMFGGYIGTGFGYSYTNFNAGDGYKYDTRSYGPLFRGGVRFGFGAGTNLGLTLGFFFKPGLEKEKFKTYGMNLFFDL